MVSDAQFQCPLTTGSYIFHTPFEGTLFLAPCYTISFSKSWHLGAYKKILFFESFESEISTIL